MNKVLRPFLCLLLAGVLSASIVPRSAAPDWSGTWVGKAVVGTFEDPMTLVLKPSGRTYSGTLQDEAGQIAPGTEIKDVQVLPKNVLKFSFQTVNGAGIEMTVTVDGEAMKGEWVDASHGEQGPVELARRK